MNVSELLAELEQQPGPDLEHKLLGLAKRFRQEVPDDEALDALRAQIENLRLTNDRLEHTVNELRDEVARSKPEPVNNSYSLEEFQRQLCYRRGRTYGWRTDYAQATHDTPGCKVVDTDDIQKWQKDKRVPDWAFTQIEILEFRVREGRSAPVWKPDEIQHLIDLYEANPQESNAVLAAKCQEHFGRDINVPAIKGLLHRLGKASRLPQHRSR